MKTEQQVLDRMEKVVNELVSVAEKMTEEEKNQLSESAIAAAVLCGMVLSSAWILDQEEAIKDIVATFSVASFAELLKGKL
jgi:hypothetical protein